MLVCNNVLCHSRIGDILSGGTTLLRLAPYSPALNPIDTVWSTLKIHVRRELRVPQIQGFGVGEQRLAYLEEVVQSSLNQLNDQICVCAVQHSTTFHADVMALNDLRVGQWAFVTLIFMIIRIYCTCTTYFVVIFLNECIFMEYE